jgi:hypothetical protein
MDMGWSFHIRLRSSHDQPFDLLTLPPPFLCLDVVDRPGFDPGALAMAAQDQIKVLPRYTKMGSSDAYSMIPERPYPLAFR